MENGISKNGIPFITPVDWPVIKAPLLSVLTGLMILNHFKFRCWAISGECDVVGVLVNLHTYAYLQSLCSQARECASISKSMAMRDRCLHAHVVAYLGRMLPIASIQIYISGLLQGPPSPGPEPSKQ